MSDEFPHLIDDHDAAELLSLPRRKVLNMARKGLVPCYALPSGDYVFSRAELGEWLRGKHVKGSEVLCG